MGETTHVVQDKAYLFMFDINSILLVRIYEFSCGA